MNAFGLRHDICSERSGRSLKPDAPQTPDLSASSASSIHLSVALYRISELSHIQFASLFRNGELSHFFFFVDWTMPESAEKRAPGGWMQDLAFDLSSSGAGDELMPTSKFLSDSTPQLKHMTYCQLSCE
jgi:hypothetical protein